MFVREGVSLGGKELSIEVGRMAKQADGAVVVRVWRLHGAGHGRWEPPR